VRELAYDRSRLERLRHGAVVARTEAAVFRVEGAGAVDCLQGLLTNDLVKPGQHSLVYGAMLTPKGMIVVDLWVIRQPERLTLIAPADARDAALELMRRQLPPRLAALTDVTGEVEVAWLAGGQGFSTLARSGLRPLPDAAGRVTTVACEPVPIVLALAHDAAPFTALAVGPREAVAAVSAALALAGAHPGAADDLEAARILAGWPARDAEIDERTLPQEVRYDEIGGVSYTKGCYVGQETVARLHFRGHTNRELRGLLWFDPHPLSGDVIMSGDRQVGTVRSVLALEDRRLGLAPIRREVEPGATVVAGGRDARVVPLPFGADELDATAA
jgi:folate-binding protein YgfZ